MSSLPRKKPICAAALFLSIALTAGGLRLSCSGAAQVYRSVPTNAMRIALTFDDGPHPSQTRRILDILDRYQAQATFFMIGVNVERYPQAAAEVAARGHEIGNHTFSHSRLTVMEPSAVADELRRCEEALWKHCQYRPKLFRPPEGFLNEGVLQCSEGSCYSLILWSIDTRDWEVKDASAIAEEVLTHVKPGAIVLMHDYVANSKTPEALEILLPRLQALGYQLVTVGELIGVA